jgi:porphobilinogen synthase
MKGGNMIPIDELLSSPVFSETEAENKTESKEKNRFVRGYPGIRMRRLRRTPQIRRMVKETRLSVDNFILPLFVISGHGIRHPISSMPGVFQMSIDEIVHECAVASDFGVPAVLLFGIPDNKDDEGRVGYAQDGIVQRAIRAIKKEVKDIFIITDVCNCEYTTHGH